MDEEPPLYIGVNLPARQGVSNQAVVDAAIAQGYDLITSRITSRTYRKRVQALYSSDQEESSTPFPIGEDLVVFPGSHVSNTIALCAPWTELDSKDSRIASMSYKVLEHEISYANFCGLPYVVIEGPKRRTHLARYAQSLRKLLQKFPEIKLLVHTTFTEDFRDGNPPPDLLSTWEVWDGIRVLCGHPANLGLALDVQRNRVPEFVVSRWLCEPIMMLVLGESCAFVPNPKNYPVLPKHIQNMARELAKLRPFFLIKENLWSSKSIKYNGGDDACLIYLRNLLAPPDPRLSQISQNSRASRHVDAESPASSVCDILEENLQSYHIHNPTSAEMFEATENYADYNQLVDVLQEPLQPLHSGLTSSVYEVFEADTAKYNQYFKATAAAIDQLNKTTLNRQETLHIAVLGAGRGALVDRVLDAIVSTRIDADRAVEIYAVEMHCGPVSFLEARKASEPVWQSVHIIKSDIRDWVPPQPMHLIISELLGSFGDNELSPECLSAIERNPNVLASTGIMIPSQYTSYVAPLYSPILWSKAHKTKAKEGESLEKPYVVYIRQGEIIAEPQSVWKFNHPAAHKESCKRQAKVSFSSPSKTRVYGFAGYFQAVLFKHITLSTLPFNATAGLKSWFPMYFPIAQPLDVLKDSSIDISIWRETDKSRVWYEWAVESHLKRIRTGSTTVHNTDGQSFSLLLH